MANRSDDEMAKDSNETLVRLDGPSDIQGTEDEATSSPASPPQQQIAEQHQQMINKLRVQMLEAQKVCAAALATTAVATTSTNSTASIEDGRYCWVCFATDEDDKMAAWVQPCKCSGTTKWVHQVINICHSNNRAFIKFQILKRIFCFFLAELPATLGGRKTKRECIQTCQLSTMSHRIYHRVPRDGHIC